MCFCRDLIQRKKKKRSVFLVFFFLFRPFFSSSLSFKRYTQTDNERKEKEQRHARTQPRERDDNNCKRTAAEKQSLSPPLKNYLRKEREREREKERQRESKKESAKNFRCIIERNVFFSFARKKKRISHLISLISSLLERLRESRCKETEEKEEEEEEEVVEEVVRRVKESSRLSRRKCEENERQRNRWWIILRVKGVKEKISPHRLSGGVRGARSNSR